MLPVQHHGATQSGAEQQMSLCRVPKPRHLVPAGLGLNCQSVRALNVALRWS